MKKRYFPGRKTCLIACRLNKDNDMTNRHFEVAVIGGGIYGSAVAYFLSCRGIRVVLLERGVVGGEGATAWSGGIVRVYDPDPVLADFALSGAWDFAECEPRSFSG